MGTTLQAPPFNLALDSALWSSELLATQHGRDQLAQLHDTWIQAGADLVQTCTSVHALGESTLMHPSGGGTDQRARFERKQLPVDSAAVPARSRLGRLGSFL